MTQLAEYVTLVRDKGYDGTSGTTDAMVGRAVNAARRRLIKDRRWRFLETANTSLVTVALNPVVSLASITGLAHVDAVRPVLAGVERETEFQPLQELRHRQTVLPATGIPHTWTRRNASLLLYPTPDVVYTLNIEYVARLDDLAGATEDTIPEDLQDLVAWAAVPDLAFRQRDSAAMQMAEAQYQQLLRQAAAQENVQQRQASRQVRSGYWGGQDYR